MKNEILKDVKKMKLEQAVKVFVTQTKNLRAKLERIKHNLKLSIETTFSDLQSDDNGKGFLLEELEDIQDNIKTHNALRQVLRKRYDAEIRKGRSADGLKVIRKFEVNFIFPNIYAKNR